MDVRNEVTQFIADTFGIMRILIYSYNYYPEPIQNIYALNLQCFDDHCVGIAFITSVKIALKPRFMYALETINLQIYTSGDGVPARWK